MSLPTPCNGKEESFRNFIVGFEYVPSKQALNSYDKLVYLIGKLSMDPRAFLVLLNMKKNTPMRMLMKEIGNHREVERITTWKIYQV